MVLARRAQTIAQVTFPPEWSETERQNWLAVWQQVRAAKDDLKRVVLVTGVFDLFHAEHLNFLRRARQIGNYLVVGVESDERVRETKGPHRPIQPASERLQAVRNSGVVDVAAILPEEFSTPAFHRALLQIVRPHWLAVSSHSPFQTQKAELMQEIGGELVVVYQHNPLVSTTNILKQGTIKQ